MNKIVRDHYPIEKLPDDLKSGLQKHGWARIEIEPETPQAAPSLARLVGSGRNVHGSPDDIQAHVRSLREDR